MSYVNLLDRETKLILVRLSVHLDCLTIYKHTSVHLWIDASIYIHVMWTRCNTTAIFVSLYERQCNEAHSVHQVRVEYPV